MVHTVSLNARPTLYVEVGCLMSPFMTGVGRFVARLIDALLPLAHVRLVSMVDRDTALRHNQADWLTRGEEIVVDPARLSPCDHDVATWARELFRLPKQRHDAHVAAQTPGLYSMLRPYRRHFGRELGILYDFTPDIVRWAHHEDTCTAFGSFFSENAAQCDHLIAISAATRSDARWLSTAPQDRISVGYPGASMCVKHHAFQGQTQRRSDAILVVSTLEPRKNCDFLVDWFLNTPELPPNFTLQWVGVSGWKYDLPQTRNRQGRQVEFLGKVSDARLCQLYHEAAFTIYPSLYEGFGLPVLDALRHGLPVMCSYNSSMKEFEGCGASFFDPCDPSTLDEATRELMPRLGAAPMLSPAALDDRFSWRRLAQTCLSHC